MKMLVLNQKRFVLILVTILLTYGVHGTSYGQAAPTVLPGDDDTSLNLDLGHQMAGYYTEKSHAAYWDGRNEWGERVASGIYFYQLRADGYSQMRKMVIVK